MYDWIRGNVAPDHPGELPTDWASTFAACLWRIWIRRNRMIIAGVTPPLSQVVSDIFFLRTDIRTAFHDRFHSPPSSLPLSIQWYFPPRGRFKLNVDGCAKGNPGLDAFGGVFQDHHGLWVLGFARKIGWCSNLLAELHGIRDGLLLARDRGLLPLLLESDSQLAIDLLQRDDVGAHPYRTIIHDCRDLLLSLGVVSLSHVYREANFVADFLASLGLSISCTV